MIFVQPAKLGILAEIADVVQSGFVVAVGENPARHGTTENRAATGSAGLLRIRIAVMMAMISGPPEHALLRGSLGHEGDHKLEGSGWS